MMGLLENARAFVNNEPVKEPAENCHCGGNHGEPTYCIDCGENTCEDCAGGHECGDGE